jgi:gluconate 5-dehydrogenase
VNNAGCTWGAPVNFPRALAAEWGQYNIHVNAICPAFFPTKMSQGLLDNIEQKYDAQTPAARLGNDEDLYGLILLLASQAQAT